MMKATATKTLPENRSLRCLNDFAIYKMGKVLFNWLHLVEWFSSEDREERYPVLARVIAKT